MKDLCQYGNRPEDEWEILPWIPDPRPPFKIWVKPEQIAPFFLIVTGRPDHFGQQHQIVDVLGVHAEHILVGVKVKKRWG